MLIDLLDLHAQDINVVLQLQAIVVQNVVVQVMQNEMVASGMEMCISEVNFRRIINESRVQLKCGRCSPVGNRDGIVRSIGSIETANGCGNRIRDDVAPGGRTHTDASST